ncbi:hypothetical protein U1839_21415, partial [Sphingomonas sp. RT2P30]|uniref:hypothetical protein n=1 Tax=Parasphingomonas halimpatiens TaxID=3096162 RepID=UPI002FC7D6C7
LCCRRAVSVQAICFSYRLDNDGESQPTDIAQPLSARALTKSTSFTSRVIDRGLGLTSVESCAFADGEVTIDPKIANATPRSRCSLKNIAHRANFIFRVKGLYNIIMPPNSKELTIFLDIKFVNA